MAEFGSLMTSKCRREQEDLRFREVCHASVGDQIGKIDVFLAEISWQRVDLRRPSHYEEAGGEKVIRPP